MQRRGRKGLLYILPFLTGSMVFYIIPFFTSIYYSLTSGIGSADFVGIRNYKDLIENPYFILALKNTALFMGISIPLILASGLMLAVFFENTGRLGDAVRGAMLIPYFLPAASGVLFLRMLLGESGVLHAVTAYLGMEKIDFLKGYMGLFVLVCVFLWKNCGIILLLYTAGLRQIPGELYDNARIYGAGKWTCLYRITIPLLTPTTFLAFLFAVIHSFKVFREIFLLTGSYPDMKLYFIQHFMNNNFRNLNYQRLTSAAVLLGVVIIAVILLFYWKERKSAYLE